jgi:hypothetical protein
MVATPAWSATNWTFTCSSCTNSLTSSAGYGNTRTSTNGGVKVTASAWANTYNSANTYLENAYLGMYSGGLGVTNRDGVSPGNGTDANEAVGTPPEHAIDNNGRWDAVMFSFADSTTGAALGIQLEQVQIGWYQTDADISVFRYTGSGAPNLGDNATSYGDGKTTTAGGLAAKGWELVGNYADLQSKPNMTANLNTTSAQVSSYWLVMAYNTAFAWKGCTGGSCTNGTTTTWDYFKVNSIGGDKYNGAPEPGSLALVGATLAGALWTRRKRKLRA